VTDPTGGHYIDGYTNRLSVAPGEQLGFHISTSLKKYSLEVARVGANRHVVWRKEGLPGAEHPIPADASSHGCRWPLALKLSVPDDWRSGYYSVVMRGAAEKGQTVSGEMSFVVRSAFPGRDSRILLQRTTNTDNAYNNFGGTALYSGPRGPGWRVSFDRPFAGFEPVGKFLCTIEGGFHASLDARIVPHSLQTEFAEHGIALTPFHFVVVADKGMSWHVFDDSLTLTLKQRDRSVDVYDAFTVNASCWHRWEKPFVRWAEQAGYQLDYAVNSDLEFRPEILENYRLVLSVGHDEYWSSPMRDNLEAFIASGGNVAFFSGNNLWWQVRSVDNGRALICWKDHERDPFYDGGDHKLLSTLWCHHLIGRPENQLTGVSFAYGGYHRFFDKYQDGPDGYTVHKPDHWIFAGTGLQRGDLFGVKDKIVGYECDGCELEWRNGLPCPIHREGALKSFEVLATAPAALSDADGSLELASRAIYGEGTDTLLPQPGSAVIGTYTCGGTVVTVGSTDWPSGLRGGDKAVARITANVLERLLV